MGARKKPGMRVFFPYEKIRLEQDRLLNDVMKAIENKKHLLCHAPTGLGKTAGVLCPALSHALQEQKTVFFLTPKISQHEIAVQLVKDLNKKFGLGIQGIDLVGRKFMCSNLFLSDAMQSAFYELCRKKRRREECEFYENIIGFDSKQREKARLYQSELKKEYDGIWSHLELKDYCENAFNGKGLCAYEAAMLLAKKSSIVIADYYHLFNPGIQGIVLQKAKKKLKDCILVIDEAHNLPERVRKLLGATLSIHSIDRAIDELDKLNQPGLTKRLQAIKKIVKGIGRQKLSAKKTEALIARETLSKELKKIDESEMLSVELRDFGAEFIEAFPQGRSFLISIANFLERWSEEQPSYIRIVKSTGKNISIQLKALDPGIVTKKIFSESHSSILMSGTLLPTKMYSDLLGLDENRTELKEYSSPFPRENKLSLVVPTVTTKYSRRNPEEFERIAGIVSAIVDRIPGNSAVFFPSFELIETIAPLLEEKTSRVLLKQKREMNSRERFNLLNRFKQHGTGFGAVLLAVASGSFSEGIDFFGEQLLGAIIVGIPLGEMDLEVECLIKYYQEKFGSGWHYGYLYPAVARAIQASGRVIRDRNDRGVIVFLDKRYTWQNYEKCFPKDFEKIVTEKPEKFVEEFWKKKSQIISS